MCGFCGFSGFKNRNNRNNRRNILSYLADIFHVFTVCNILNITGVGKFLQPSIYGLISYSKDFCGLYGILLGEVRRKHLEELFFGHGFRRVACFELGCTASKNDTLVFICIYFVVCLYEVNFITLSLDNL